MGTYRESLAATPQNSTHRRDLTSLLAEGLERLGLVVDRSVEAALL